MTSTQSTNLSCGLLVLETGLIPTLSAGHLRLSERYWRFSLFSSPLPSLPLSLFLLQFLFCLHRRLVPFLGIEIAFVSIFLLPTYATSVASDEVREQERMTSLLQRCRWVSWCRFLSRNKGLQSSGMWHRQTVGIALHIFYDSLKKKLKILYGRVSRCTDLVACPAGKVGRAWRRFADFWVTHTHAVAWLPLWMPPTCSVRQSDETDEKESRTSHSRGSNGRDPYIYRENPSRNLGNDNWKM